MDKRQQARIAACRARQAASFHRCVRKDLLPRANRANNKARRSYLFGRMNRYAATYRRQMDLALRLLRELEAERTAAPHLRLVKAG